MYHRVAEESFDPWGLAVTPARFSEQIEWLSRNRTLLPLAELADLHRERRLPANAAALTFDDGYECVASIAAPMLCRLGFPATVFIPAELIERGQPFWWDELQAIVLGNHRDAVTLRSERIPLGTVECDDARWKPGASPKTRRQIAFHRISSLLREMTPEALEIAMNELREQSPKTAWSGPRPMSPEQLRATASARIDFGSHALTHPWLTSLSHAEKRREIADSIAHCERLSGRAPTSFAYPYGNFDWQSEQAVKEAGFACACATGGTAVAAGSSLFALPRVQVGDWSPGQLAFALDVA